MREPYGKMVSVRVSKRTQSWCYDLDEKGRMMMEEKFVGLLVRNILNLFVDCRLSFNYVCHFNLQLKFTIKTFEFSLKRADFASVWTERYEKEKKLVGVSTARTQLYDGKRGKDNVGLGKEIYDEI